MFASHNMNPMAIDCMKRDQLTADIEVVRQVMKTERKSRFVGAIITLLVTAAVIV